MYGVVLSCVFFFKQKTAYEMRISDWSSDVCSSDLPFASFGTANRVMPPSVFAATMLMSATCPWRTKLFLPSRRKPLPARVAVVAIRSGRCLAPSSIASATIVSPDAIEGSQRPACVPPALASAATAPTLVDRKGDGEIGRAHV